MMTGREDVEIKPVLLNDTYAIMKTYTKPYASCRYTHPAVEAAIHMRNRVRPEEVKEIIVRTYELAVSGHDHSKVHGSYSAKMSIPYALAAGLMFGKAGLQEFSEEIVENGGAVELAKKVKVLSDDELNRTFPDTQSAIVTIVTEDGEYCERVDFPKGEPENPLTADEFRSRYDELMRYAGTDAEVSEDVYRKALIGMAEVSELVDHL